MPRPPKLVLFSKKEAGQRVRLLRDERGLSQVELSKALGVHQTNVSAMERGTRALTIHQVVKLAQVLRVSIDEILSGKKPQENGHLDRRFARRLQRIEGLPKRDQQALLRTIDNFLKAAQV